MSVAASAEISRARAPGASLHSLGMHFALLDASYPRHGLPSSRTLSFHQSTLDLFIGGGSRRGQHARVRRDRHEPESSVNLDQSIVRAGRHDAGRFVVRPGRIEDAVHRTPIVRVLKLTEDSQGRRKVIRATKQHVHAGYCRDRLGILDGFGGLQLADYQNLLVPVRDIICEIETVPAGPGPSHTADAFRREFRGGDSGGGVRSRVFHWGDDAITAAVARLLV